ncbi:putative ubiquitin carboxyl-terminal hydrolase 8 [Golovinomyces cichoracearum]|uniref:Ubiquitin carboxyl-terminal hydrolase n=1 Tax=Golovinomyces cichoracearum TaxID=62708 RepID=A0A420IEV0_9PEZI|nr:putative ubiquitin carboxyl-terminal hydrolase 8 [Golovinomyces cichoracearum]
MTSGGSETPGPPTSLKIKPSQNGVPQFGCVHLQRHLTEDVTSGEKHLRMYTECLRCIVDGDPALPQTSQTSKGLPLVTLTPNYLCIQCNTTTSEKCCKRHSDQNSHRFFVESRTGAVFCHSCHDFVWDPTLEELRIQKFGAGTIKGTQKRKHDELSTEQPQEETNMILASTIETSCRVSGIRGIYNMGSTCYINVILQCIVNNPLLRNWYLGCNHQSSDCTIKACMSCSIDIMFQEFYSQDSTSGFCAAQVLACFWLSKRKAYEELASNNEQDAHEFLTFLAEELHEINSGARQSNSGLPASKKSKTVGNSGCKCIIHQTFYGKSQSVITCQKCHRSKTSVQAFMDLSLAIDDLPKYKNSGKPSTLQSRLEEEFKMPEVCEYHCECGSNKARKVTTIKNLPNVLCIQFKRFKQTVNGAFKLSTKVLFPLKIEMLRFTNHCKIKDVRKSSLARECTYELQSVVEHVGELKKGHYISYSRVGKQWFKFNDHKVTLATKSEVLSAEAYILFYVIQSLASDDNTL